MDILSLGLAGKADKMAKANEAIIGKKAEGRHRTVASRLAYLENQAAGLLVDVIRQASKENLSLTNVSLDGTAYKLTATANGFMKQGMIDTGVIDLGAGMHEVNSILVEEQKTIGQHVIVKAAFSNDNVTWSTFAPLPLAEIPNARYWRLQIELKVDVAGKEIETKAMTDTAFTGIVQSGLTEVEGTSVRSANKETYTMTGETVDETSTLYSVTFEKPTLGKIGTVTMKEG